MYTSPKSHLVLNLSSKAIGELVEEFMQKEKTIKFKTKGHSMRPIISEGDIITLSPYIQRSPNSGDIVAYIDSFSKGLIIHRLIRFSKSTFIAKGDNCRNNDAIHSKKCILGYVSQINQKVSIRNKLLLPSLKRVLTLFSTISLFFLLNKFLKRFQLPL